MVSIPRRLASSKARTKLAELPLVDRPTAMSFRPPNAAIWRAKTTSTPTSLHSAVTTEVSLASPNAGSGRASPPGFRNRVASWAASVALPPLPKANSRPPAANLAAACRAQSAIRAPSRTPTTRRSSRISSTLARVEARTCPSTAGRSEVSEYRNGYSDSIASSPGRFSCRMTRSLPYHGDGFPGVHQDRVAHAGRHQGHADRLLPRAGVDHGQLVLQQPQHRDLDRGIGTGDADVTHAAFPAPRRLSPVRTPAALPAGCARKRIWCAKIAATPSRSAIPVTVATSVVSEMAGSARLPTMTGWTNSTATCCASVLAPPMPNTTSLPPR